MTKVIKEERGVKSYQYYKVLQMALITDLPYPDFWKSFEEQLTFYTLYDNIRDIVQILILIKEISNGFSQTYWEKMMDKILFMKENWTSKDIVETLKIF